MTKKIPSEPVKISPLLSCRAPVEREERWCETNMATELNS